MPTILGNANAITAIPIDETYYPPFAGMIFDIDTTNTTSGGSNNQEIRLPFQPTAYEYSGISSGLNLDIIVDWGDGNTDTYNTNPVVDYVVSHAYASPGIYTIKIDSPSNSIQGWNTAGGTSQAGKYDRNKIINLKQWGYFDFAGITYKGVGTYDGYWSVSYFAQIDKLVITATDVPQITGDSLADAFGSSEAALDIPNLNLWDVSGVTDFGGMFGVSACGGVKPIGDVSSWNMSNATDIGQMFGSSDFNGDVSGWDVSNVTTMNSVFTNTPFNGDLGSWDVGNADIMASMFSQCTNFTGIGLENWVLNTTPNWGGVGVANLNSMFSYCTNFNRDISSWDFSKVGQCTSMFRNCTSFNQDISAWDMSGTHYTSGPANVGSIYDMFSQASNFDQDLSSWDFGLTTCILRFGGTGIAGDLNLSPTNYDATLIGFATRIPYTNAKTSTWCGAQIWEFGVSQYNLSNAAAVTARNALIADMGGIVDGGGI